MNNFISSCTEPIISINIEIHYNTTLPRFELWSLKRGIIKKMALQCLVFGQGEWWSVNRGLNYIEYMGFKIRS